jgi:hypothetical protein
VIDDESARAIATWLRLGDRFAGRKSIEGKCDRCGATANLNQAGRLRLCAKCYIESEAA